MEDALVIFHQLARDERQDGSLGPLARIKVDEKKCFGMIEWRAVRKPQPNFCPNARRAVSEISPDLACGEGAGGTDPL